MFSSLNRFVFVMVGEVGGGVCSRVCAGWNVCACCSHMSGDLGSPDNVRCEQGGAARGASSVSGDPTLAHLCVCVCLCVQQLPHTHTHTLERCPGLRALL